jgi:hypothetical protein
MRGKCGSGPGIFDPADGRSSTGKPLLLDLMRLWRGRPLGAGGDDAAPPDFEVGKPTGAHLFIEQVVGEPGDLGSLVG